jgi:hypothetical protein
MPTWYDASELPEGQRRVHKNVMKAIREEREERDDTPEGEDRRWGPLKVKRPNRQRRQRNDTPT